MTEIIASIAIDMKDTKQSRLDTIRAWRDGEGTLHIKEKTVGQTTFFLLESTRGSTYYLPVQNVECILLKEIVG